jgi:DeoR family fructose operon transcriptional repressor
MELPLPAERHRRIVEQIHRHPIVRVSALAQMLDVSEVTIRRDLEELEGRGILERTHGGAVRSQRIGPEPSYLEAVARRSDEKRAIGRTAAATVRPRDTVFLNGGTTTLEVFRHLDSPDVKVVTNHVGMTMESADPVAAELILIGGEYRAPSNSCVGAFATEALRRVFASRAFIGVEGLSPRSGVTTPAAPEAEIARVMIEQTQGPVTVVADSSKVGAIAEFAIAPLERLTSLVTDSGIDPAYREELEHGGLEVVVAGRVHAGAPGGAGSG